MSELAVVRLEPVRFHVMPAAEILLPQLVPRARRALEILLMAGSKNNFSEDAMSAELVGGTAFAAPANLFFGLWTAALSDTSTGSAASESAYGAYARVSKTNNTTNFAGTTSPRTNSTAITFPQSTSGTSTVTYVGVCSASSAGDMYLWADLTASRTIDVGETPEFAVSAFSYSED
jgi:hypothetical protein